MRAYSRSRLPTMLMLFAVVAAAGAAESEAAGPADTLIAFDAAIPGGDAEQVVRHLADGGMQFTLKSPHEGFVPEKLTTDIVPYWQMVAPVISSSTSQYERNVRIIAAREMGNIATVWATIDTRRQLKGKDVMNTAPFNHVYLLILTPDGWKIAGMADNRAVDRIDD